MAKVMKLPNLKNKPSRNGFDISRRNHFTAKCGEILPVASINVIPGDVIDIDLSMFTRSMPVNTSAFTRIREYLDVVFVPFNLLWKDFNTFITKMDDNVQFAASLTEDKVQPETLPWISTKDLHSYLYQAHGDKAVNAFGYDRGLLSAKLIDYLDYGRFYDDCTKTWSSSTRWIEQLSVLPFLAYQKAYMDHFRYEQWEEYDASTCNLDFVNASNLHLQLPDHYARDKKNTIFDLRYANHEKDYYFGILPSSQYGSESVVKLDPDSSSESVPFSQGVALSDLDHRPTNKWEQFLASGASAGDTYLKGVYKMGDSDAVVHSKSQSDYIGFKLTADDVSRLKSAMGGAPTSSFSILQLRAAEALQRWKEIAQSGDQDYSAQIEKFFGCSVPAAYSNLSYYVGGHVQNFEISEVVNQNLAGEGAQADIAGIGRGSGSGHIRFDNNKYGNQFGLLLVLYHNRPLIDYNINRCDIFNKKIRVDDFANPMFDKIGMQQVNMLNMFNSPATYQLLHDLTPEQMFYGYVPRYAEYKTSVDTLHGGFAEPSAGLTHWSSPVNDIYLANFFINLKHGQSFDYNAFKINPALLGPIFAIQQPDANLNTDQFLVDAGFDIKVVRNLDYNGLPY